MRGVSEYGKELREKQKLKAWYNLGERQFGNYVKEILKKSQKTENAASLLIKVLEKRLDNVVFRLGLSSSRSQARQLVSHGQILINNRSTTAPGYSLKKGDEISAAPSFFRKNTNALENLKTALKKKQPPVWLSFNSDKLKGEVIGEPSLEEAAPPAEISLIFEFYSK